MSLRRKRVGIGKEMGELSILHLPPQTRPPSDMKSVPQKTRPDSRSLEPLVAPVAGWRGERKSKEVG